MEECIGSRIKKIRKERNLTAIKMSKLLGTSRDYIYLVEKGSIKAPTIDKIKKIADLLGISLDLLVEGLYT